MGVIGNHRPGGCGGRFLGGYLQNLNRLPQPRKSAIRNANRHQSAPVIGAIVVLLLLRLTKPRAAAARRGY